ncbi:MAG: type II secretion system protein GspN [Bdellovibrionales bacterium]|nr:type II secretion system protein GspN [Bdellovibrionales bacterium]
MPALKKVIEALGSVFRFHKLKILSLFLFALGFFLLRFPYGDLSGFITAQVSQRSAGNAYLEFEDMNLRVFPGLGMRLSQVNLSLARSPLPELKMASLVVAPNWLSLLRFAPGASLSAEDLWQGDLSLSVALGGKIGDEGRRWQNIDTTYQDFSLAQLIEALDLPVRLGGQGQLSAAGKLDPQFSEQPDLTINALISPLEVPAQTLQIGSPMGPIPFPLPNLSFKDVKLKGRWLDGDFIVEDMILGAPTDKINARLQGRLGLQLQRGGLGVRPAAGAYDFNLELNIHKELEKNFSVLLFIDKFKKPTSTGTLYRLRVSGTRVGAPATMGKFDGF